jgi:hypothetical protein
MMGPFALLDWIVLKLWQAITFLPLVWMAAHKPGAEQFGEDLKR